MTTAREIVDDAMREAGVLGLGQTLNAQDENEGFRRLNQMISQWARKRWLVYRLLDVAWTSDGSSTFTIGPSGDVTTATDGTSLAVRPDRLETNGFIRQINNAAPNQPDFPLRLLESREDYNKIRMKSLTAYTYYLWYDPTIPNGTVYPWPIPTSALYEIHILMKLPFAAFASLDSDVDFPAEYEPAMLYQLALRLRSKYQVPTPPGDLLLGLAKDAMAVLRGANTAIANLSMPTSLQRPGLYNILSDQVY